jgi:hypothetical protein
VTDILSNRPWGFAVGFLVVAPSALATPYMPEFVYALLIACACATAVMVMAVTLRLTAPRPGLTSGLVAGALSGVFLVLLVLAGFTYVVVSNHA